MTGTVNVADLRLVDWGTATAEEHHRILARGSDHDGVDEGLRASIATIVEDVRKRGDAALVDALGRFDKMTLPAQRLLVSEEEFAQARAAVSKPLIEAIRTSIAQVRAFNELIVERASWTAEPRPGLLVGEQATAIPSVGLFVPSGKGSFPSVLIQIATPAVVAGVERIVVMVPPVPGGSGQVDPATLVAAQELGLSEVYRSNGPAGIAALACGTETVPKVRKIVGPGSPAVACAQLEVQRLGCVVEVGFGPTDALIVADDSADLRLLAADLINEAEHGPDSSAVLVSTSRTLLEGVRAHVAEQLAELPEPRRTYATTSIAANGGLVLAASREEAMEVANAYAPEHLQLAVAEPKAWLPLAKYSGTVLLGQWTTFAASNFAIGTPATLPTTGFAQVSSGVTASTYLVRAALAQLDEAEFRRLAPVVTELAGHEGFPAHTATVTVRERASE
ncbi:histidinol dehydrogenase [Streptomyces bluensis]|uniref:histidinol dehydrogenase n=1 Tax=Streptomyces bluensis TaxID=33897 RepID=UPI00167A14A9|nr:histidinol dehydrogenase [Streptomyces bluensis]GGZ92902.1 histidinol dehydrogenase [Streptomyces bluensis]